MTRETQPASPDWLTEHVRLTGFTRPPLPPSLARDWWHALTGAPAERVIEEPRTGKVELLGVHAAGPLHLSAEHDGRLDIRHPFAVAQLTLPFTDALPPFAELMAPWLSLESSPPFQRLAFGCSIVKPFPQIADCREELDRYLPTVDMKSTQTRDFLYQVNHRCPAQAVDDLMVNRITKWSIRELNAPAGEASFSVQLELDINTIPDHEGNLDHPAELFRELTDYANHFAQKGDRP